MRAAQWLTTLRLARLLYGLPAALGVAAMANSARAKAPAGPGAAELVEIELVADTARIAPGRAFHVAVVFTVAPDWHIYWKDPGEGALAPVIELDAPAGFAVGEPRWPRPVAHETPVGTAFCYFGEAAVFLPVTAPADVTDGVANFDAEITWAVCDEQVCRIGSAEMTLSVQTAASAAAPRDETPPRLREHRRRLPRDVADVASAAAEFDGPSLTISGPADGHETATFFPVGMPGLTYGEPDIRIADGRFTVAVPITWKPRNALGRELVLEGLVALGSRPGDPSYDFRIPRKR